MAFTHTTGITYKSDAGTITSTTEVFTGDGEADYDGIIPAGAVNLEIDVPVTVANIRSMVLFAATLMTVKTNSTSAPDDTLNINAGTQIVWNTNHSEPCPLTVNVVKFYVSNPGSVAGAFKFRALVNLTPVGGDPA